MEAYLPYLISVIGGAVIPAILARFGIKLPVITPSIPVTPSQPTPSPSPWPAPMPQPQPGPAPAQAPDPALTSCLEWSARAKARLIPVTEADRQAAGALVPMLSEFVPAPAQG